MQETKSNTRNSDFASPRTAIDMSYRMARRIVIGVVGVLVCLTGVVMLIAPGPAFIVIPAGLAILGLEFSFARRWLRSIRKRISKTAQKKRLSKR